MDKVGKQTLEEMQSAVWYNKHIYTTFKNYLSGEILEIGFGIGNFVNLLKKSGKLTSIDVNRQYLKNFDDKGKLVKVGFGDIEKNMFFFGNKKFNSIISINVFEHIRDDTRAFRNSYRLLKNGGYFVILVPAHQQLYSKFDKALGHYRRYSKASLGKCLKDAKFKIVQVRYFNWWAAAGWFLFVKIMATNKMPATPVKIFDIFGKYFLKIEKFLNPPFGLSVIAICKK